MLYPEEAAEAYAKLYTNSVNAVVSKMNFKAQGIDEKEWKKHSRELGLLAYEDNVHQLNLMSSNGR